MCAILFGFLVAGCASTIGLRDSEPEKVEFNYSVFANRQYRHLAVETVNFLNSKGWYDYYLDHPREVIIYLYGRIADAPTRLNLEILADLCYNQAKQESEPEDALPYYLTTAQITEYYLFSPELPRSPSAGYEPMTAIMGSYYNYSTLKIFDFLRSHNLELASSYQLTPVAGPAVEMQSPLNLANLPLDECSLWQCCANYEPVNNFVFSFRRGIGVPLLVKPPEAKGEDNSPLREQILLAPVTLFLRFEPVTSLKTARQRARLEYIDPLNYEYLTVDGVRARLALDVSTTLAFALSKRQSPRDLLYLFDPEAMNPYNGLYFGTRITPDRIPVVFTHGLMSNPRTWVQMLNSLYDDPRIRRHYQFWLFAYPTGNPLVYSAREFRKALIEAQARYGDQIVDFDQMVLIGHSMGGLVTRCALLESDDQFADFILHDQLKLDTVTEEQRKCLTFKPLPFVKRAVFIATPHRGSEMATWSLTRWASSLIELPAKLNRVAGSILERLKLTLTPDKLRFRTGLDNLAPNDAMLGELIKLSSAPNVPFHTISGNRDRAGVLGGTDGVVPYWSSHLDGAASELVVKSNHSAHQTPAAIEEVHRILIDHLIGLGKLNADGSEKDEPVRIAPDPAF